MIGFQPKRQRPTDRSNDMQVAETRVSPTGGRRVGLGAAFLLAYLCVDYLTHHYAQAPFDAAPWNPRPALVIALIAFGGPSFIPVALLAVFGARLLLRGDDPTPTLLLSFAVLAAVQCAAGLAVRRFTRWLGLEVTLRDVSILVAVALAAACVAAVDRPLAMLASGRVASGDLPAAMLRILIGNVLGTLVLMPLLLQLAAGAWPRLLEGTSRRIVLRDTALFVAALAVLLRLVFGFDPITEFEMSYLLFLPMIVVAIRYGLFGVAATLPMVQVGALAALVLLGTRSTTLFEFQMLMLTVAITSLYLGTLSDERQRSARRVVAHEQRLREQGLALGEAQRSAGAAELAAALAHDLSQPLSAIGTYSRACSVLAERGEPERATLLQTLERIAQESARAGQYVRRMRDFFRSGVMHEERIEVAALVDSVHAHVHDRMVRARIEWRAEIEPGVPALRADAVQLAAVLTNLLGNACEALAGLNGARAICVRVRQVAANPAAPGAPPMVRITVEDNGPGVPAEVRERLFTPLATSKPHGMGLGLALSRSIAERQGGRLWFDSTAEKTTFCLDVPRY